MKTIIIITCILLYSVCFATAESKVEVEFSYPHNNFGTVSLYIDGTPLCIAEEKIQTAPKEYKFTCASALITPGPHTFTMTAFHNMSGTGTEETEQSPAFSFTIPLVIPEGFRKEIST